MSTTRGQHLIGKVLGGCILERLLGYGGSSAVFLAQQYSPERKVAVKVFLPRSSMDKQMQRDFYNRFLREAQAASELDHPHILPIYSYGEQDSLPYIIMPYMEGGTLSEYVLQRGHLSLSEAVWYLEQIALALDYAHEQGCVHCDVKPANMLLDSEGFVTLSDFGIAQVTRSDAAGEMITKSPEVLMGTPDYISPEQALGQTLDGRSDIYSLGVTLFFLLAGQLPFQADTSIAVALLHVHEKPPALSLIRADISPALDRVIQKALAKAPAQRFQTPGEFSRAFAEAVVNAAHEDPADVTESRPKLLARVADTPQSDPKRPIVAVKPLTKVKPPGRRIFNFPQLIIAATLVVTIAFGTATAAAYITTHLANGKPISPPPVSSLPSSNSVGSLTTNNGDWPIADTASNKFFFTGQQYHILNKSQQNVALALYAKSSYNNFHLSVTMTETRHQYDDADFYGVIFRADNLHYYLFEVALADGGRYNFLQYDIRWQPDLKDSHWKTLTYGPAPSLNPEAGKSNSITVDAKGNTFAFSINGSPLPSAIIDSSTLLLSSGEVGLYVEREGTEVAFGDLYVKAL